MNWGKKHTRVQCERDFKLTFSPSYKKGMIKVILSFNVSKADFMD